MIQSKPCSRCKEVKPRKAFFIDSRNRSGLSSECRSCRQIITARWKKENREEYLKRQSFKRKQHFFGISSEEYEVMLKAQDCKCAICDKPETNKHQSGNVKTLAIDHSHESGAIRELLCSRCNNALGSFYDDPTLLEKAAAYLRKHADSPSKKIIPFKQAKKEIAAQAESEVAK